MDSAVIDPVFQTPTLSMLCDVTDPLTRQRYSRDPRTIAKKAEEYLKSTGIADTSYFGPELEFFVFDGVRLLPTPDAVRNPWAADRTPGGSSGGSAAAVAANLVAAWNAVGATAYPEFAAIVASDAGSGSSPSGTKSGCIRRNSAITLGPSSSSMVHTL